MKRTPMPTRTKPLRAAGEPQPAVKPLKAPKPPKCKVCREPATSRHGMQAYCSPACGAELAMALLAKAKRSAAREQRSVARAEQVRTKARREALVSQPQWVARAQKAFNTFIRLRDAGKPCICCGSLSGSTTHTGMFTGGDWDAGHYRSRGAAPELRFDERNCHAQLKRCNRRAWDVAAYRANLITRIGLPAVEGLEGPHPPKKYSIAELKELIEFYRAKRKALINQADKGST